MTNALKWKSLSVLAMVLAAGGPALGQYEGLVINEILPSPTNAAGVYVDANQDGAASSIDDEFIELLNTSAASIDVAGMWLTDANTNLRRHVFSSRALPPGGAIVVFGGGSLLNFSNPPAQLATGGGLSLNNDTETLHLFSPQTALVDQVSYQLTASHNAISLVRNPEGSGGFTNHYLATTNAARASPGRRTHGLPFLTNQPPVLMDLADQTAFVGLELQFPVRAWDPADRNDIALSLIDNPANSSLSATGGVGTFTFTPAPEQAGQTYAVSFVAADTNGAETNIVSIQVVNPNTAEDVWINEFHYDNDGIDSDEGVEIAGTANTVLTNYALVFYDGDNGRVDGGTNWLTGTLDDEQCGYGAAWFAYVGIENDTEGIALVKGSNVVQFLSYEGVFTASNGPALGMTSVDIGVRETAVTVGYSLQLTGTGTSYSAFAWTNARPHSRATLNAGQTIECLSPAAIEIHKTVYLGHDGGASAPGVETVQGTNGAAITYVFLVANTGGRAITNAEIQDLFLGFPPIALGTLTTGSVHTAHVETVISGDLRNTATVSGYDPDGNPVADDDTAEVVEIISSLDIQLTVYRGQDGGAACPGSAFLQATNDTPVTFCFLVENNGNTNVNSLVISNATLGIDPISIGTLPAGGSFATSVAAVVTSSLTHVATVSGTDPNNDPISDQDSATVEIIHPALLLQKTVYRGHDGGAACPGGENVTAAHGAPITYCFFVSNSGDVTLTNVMLVDTNLSGFAATPLGTLATGTTQTVHFETVVDGERLNTAQVSGYAPEGTVVAAEDTAAVDEFAPGVALQFSVYRGQDGGGACPGEAFLQATNGTPVTFCLIVTNSGDVALTSLVAQATSLGQPAIPVGTLAPGGVFATALAAVVTGSLAHVATVNGRDPNGDSWAAAATATVQQITAALHLQKTVYLGHDGGAACPGGENVTETNGAPLTYCFLVTNAGDTVLTNLVLTDNTLSGFPPTLLGTLESGQTASVYFESVLLETRVNTATVTATTVLGDTLTAADSASVTLWIPPEPFPDAEYIVIDLGTLGGNASEAKGLNDRSQVVGWARDASNRVQAFRWENGTMTGLGFLTNRWSNSVAQAINNQGKITGYSSVSATNVHAFYCASNQMTDLGTLGGPNSWGRAINERSEIAGSAQVVSNFPSDSDPKSFLWRSNQMIYIPTYIFHYSCDAYGVDEQGRVCGSTFTWANQSPTTWGYVWEDKNTNGVHDTGEMKVIGSLGTSYTVGSGSGARAMNDIGQLTGWSYITNAHFPYHAFLLTSSNGLWKIPDNEPAADNNLMQDLGALDSPSQNSYANAINNKSWVVGLSSSTSGTNQAFLWRHGIMTNLNYLIPSNSGWILTNATAINEHNEIAGSGFYQGQTRAFLLSQRGRITHIKPLWQTNTWIYTNELAQIITQSTMSVTGQVVQWAGIWGGTLSTAYVFTVESCDTLRPPTNWTPVVPTSQWPISDNFWTDIDYPAVSRRFYRVRAEAAP